MSEWFKEHDWKSCVRLKRTGGSNPLLCAKTPDFAGVFHFQNSFDPLPDPQKTGAFLCADVRLRGPSYPLYFTTVAAVGSKRRFNFSLLLLPKAGEHALARARIRIF